MGHRTGHFVEVLVALSFLYAFGILAILWYSLTCLPNNPLAGNFSFSLNVIQHAILSLLSFRVYRQATHFRSIFFQFWILFAVISLSGPVYYYIYSWHGARAAIETVVIENIVFHALVLWIISKILFHYIFFDEKRWAINLLSALVVLPLCGWLFWPFWFSPKNIFCLPTAVSSYMIYLPIYKSVAIVNGVSLLLLVAFFLHKLKTDKPIGAYADTTLFLFGLYVLVDTLEIVAQVKSLELMNITQWAINFLALATIVTMLMRLKYKSQTLSSYYESQCLSFDPQLGRRVGLFDRLILWCFFDPQKVSQRVYLGAGRQKMKIRRTPRPVSVSHKNR